MFLAFVTIHPYANGNGHAARLVVWALLLRYGFQPTGWPVDPRPIPADQYYLAYESFAREGKISLLASQILQAIASSPNSP
jgi:Fic family protein